jgi:hypothetical protein
MHFAFIKGQRIFAPPIFRSNGTDLMPSYERFIGIRNQFPIQIHLALPKSLSTKAYLRATTSVSDRLTRGKSAPSTCSSTKIPAFEKVFASENSKPSKRLKNTKKW